MTAWRTGQIDPSKTFNVFAANPKTCTLPGIACCVGIAFKKWSSIVFELGTSGAAAVRNCSKGQRQTRKHTLALSVIRKFWVKVHRIWGWEIEHAG